METIIKIKRSSIKKNPYAGRTIYYSEGPWHFTGNYRGAEMPQWLSNITEITSFDGFEYGFTFLSPPTPEIMEKIKKEKNLTVEGNRELNQFESTLPEPKYKFKYHNPKIECSGCDTLVRYEDIESGYFFDSDGDEHNADKCPVCGELNSFNYKLERIEEAIK